MKLTEFQEVTDILCEMFLIENIVVEIKNCQCAWARLTSNKITLPKWILKTCKPYQMSFILHEIAHFIRQDVKAAHDSLFFEIEDLLLSYYYMRIEKKPKEVYAHKLYYKGRLVKIID